jgi:hypothetical protein
MTTDITQALREAVENRKDDLVRSGKTVPEFVADIEKEFLLPSKILFVRGTLQAPDSLTPPQEQGQHDQGDPPDGS